MALHLRHSGHEPASRPEQLSIHLSGHVQLNFGFDHVLQVSLQPLAGQELGTALAVTEDMRLLRQGAGRDSSDADWVSSTLMAVLATGERTAAGRAGPGHSTGSHGGHGPAEAGRWQG